MRAAAGLALLAVRAAAGPIPLGSSERILFYGDSITEQNRYTGLVETFLITRYPDKRLEFFNYGWSGDTARGGNARWARDAAAAKPTLVCADFGMNDGAYGEFADWILDAWLPPLKGIIDQARAGGARAVLFSPSVTDPSSPGTEWLKGYDDTLARMVKAEQAFGVAEGVPVVDLNTPMREALLLTRTQQLPTMVPDGIHPDRAGALLMAWSILRAFDPPKGPGDLTVKAGTVTAGPGVATGGARVDATGIGFDLTLPYLPFWIPWESRAALPVCTFTEDLNRFRIVVAAWPGTAPAEAWLVVDGQPVGRFTPAEFARGVDLAGLDSAPWARTGRRIWELAERRNAMRFEAWRTIRLGGRDWGGAINPGSDRASMAGGQGPRDLDAATALEAAGEAMAEQMHTLAQARTYRVAISSIAPFSRSGGLPKLVDGFEDASLRNVNCWDESVSVSSTIDHPTEGHRALKVGFDAAVYAAPGATIDFPFPQDFSGTPNLSVDVALASGSLPAGSSASVTLTLNPEEPKGKGKHKKKEARLKPVELKSSRSLPAGGHATLAFDLAGADTAVIRRTASVTLTLTFSPTGDRGFVVYDNLRAIE